MVEWFGWVVKVVVGNGMVRVVVVVGVVMVVCMG